MAGSAELDGQLSPLRMEIPALPLQKLPAANDPQVLLDLIAFLNLAGGGMSLKSGRRLDRREILTGRGRELLD